MKTQSRFLKPIVLYNNYEYPLQWGKHFKKSQDLEVEIGFGMGEVLVHSAKEFPLKNFIGIEQHWERMYKTLKRIDRERHEASDEEMLTNIRILKIDARVAFDFLFSPKTIDHIYCLFPCPWPKKGHMKHRLFSQEFLRLLNNRLKPKGSVKIVTDDQSYAQWIELQTKKTGFQVDTGIIDPQYNTKFEKKWKEEGKKDFYAISFRKKRHIAMPCKKGVLLKSYRLKKFDPKTFAMEDLTGEISVIFKQMLFDDTRQKGMLLLLVSEKHLTQYFWVTISKKDDYWRLCKAEGQSFLPTKGIAKALEHAYKSCKKTAC